MVKISVVWRYFVDLRVAARCKICNGRYSLKGRGTTHLKRHLKGRHPEEYEEFCKIDDEAKSQLKTTINTPTLKSLLEQSSSSTRATTWDDDRSFQFSEDTSIQRTEDTSSEWPEETPAERAKFLMDKLVCELLALQNLPFSFVDNFGFRRVLETAVPTYQMGDSKYFLSYLCNDLYPRMMKTMQEILRRIIHLSFTTDGWTESNTIKEPLSITAHGITKGFRKITVTLDTCYFFVGHSFQDQFEAMIRKWAIKGKKIHCVMREDLTSTNYGIPCVLKQIQSCIVQTIVAQDPLFIDLITKCNHVVANLNKSQPTRVGSVRIKQEPLSEPPLEDQPPMSWDSTADMLESLLQIKNSIRDITYISTDEKQRIDKFVSIVKAFTDTAKELSGPLSLISSVIPMVHALKYTLQGEESKEHMDPYFKEIYNKLIIELDARFGDLQNDNSYAMATFLDPRYKLAFFHQSTKDRLQSDIIRYLVNDESNRSKKVKAEKLRKEEMKLASKRVDPSTSNLQSSLANMLTQSDDDDAGPEEQLLLKKSLVIKYSKERRAELSMDPLLWWKANTKYSYFRLAARQFLAPPAGCVPRKEELSAPGNEILDSNQCAKLLSFKYNLAVVTERL